MIKKEFYYKNKNCIRKYPAIPLIPNTVDKKTDIIFMFIVIPVKKDVNFKIVKTKSPNEEFNRISFIPFLYLIHKHKNIII